MLASVKISYKNKEGGQTHSMSSSLGKPVLYVYI